MAIDLCIESAGWVAHFVEVNVAHSYLPRRHARIRNTDDKTTEAGLAAATAIESGDPAANVRALAADLPIEQAGAVWLIDVCGCSYDAAAAALGVPRDDLAASVTEARRAIRNALPEPVR